MKFFQRLLILAFFLKTSSSALLKSNPESNAPKERMDWNLDPEAKKNLTWGSLAGGPAALIGFLTQAPGRDINIKKNQFGRQLRMAQTLLRAKMNENRQLLTDIDEMVHTGGFLLDQMLESTMRKINVLRSDIEIKFNKSHLK